MGRGPVRRKRLTSTRLTNPEPIPQAEPSSPCHPLSATATPVLGDPASPARGREIRNILQMTSEQTRLSW